MLNKKHVPRFKELNEQQKEDFKYSLQRYHNLKKEKETIEQLQSLSYELKEQCSGYYAKELKAIENKWGWIYK